MAHNDDTLAHLVPWDRLIVGMLLAVWLAHLFAYVWLVPPWQHYDEPTHFEYAALIRELGRLPLNDEQIPALRRAIATSMIEAGFYSNRAPPLTPPDLDAPTLSIGINERGHPPLYYALVALATAPLRNASITVQLYAARLFSVVLAGLLFGASSLTLRLLTGDDHIVRYATLAILALHPAFADIMSSVNSDVLANLVAVLLLLVGSWFLHRSNAWRLLAGLPFLLVAVSVKRVLLFYALILPLAWLLALPDRLQRWVTLAAAAAAIVVCVWLMVQPWQLAEWSVTPPTTYGYSSTRLAQRAQQPESMREAIPHAGAVAFALETRSGEPPPALSQRLYTTQLEAIAGKRLTLAAWMRADRPILLAVQPLVLIDGVALSHSLQLGTSWQRVVQTVDVPQDAQDIEVRLSAPAQPGIIWYDALALVQGDISKLPDRDQPDASFEAGLLDDTAPPNLLRNASAEGQMPALPNSLSFLAGGLFDERTLGKLFDRAWISAVYPRQALLLFQGFWGLFGWGERSVSPGWFAPLGLLVLASLLGLAWLTWRDYWPQRHTLKAKIWWLCLLAVALGWGAALLRVHSQPFPGVMFWSFGRYAFVAILPSLLVFSAGLRALMPARLRVQGLVGIIGFLMLYAISALLALLQAYA
ncbi:MAG: hypothetical protein ABIV47_24170 [Roseiflexaceae bacterium]